MGAQSRRLNIPSESAFIGKGVSYCAVCDAPFFRNKVVAVIGGGDSAIQEAIYLTKFATKVYVVHRRDQLRASQVLQERAKKNEKIEFIWDSLVDEIKGKTLVDTLVLRNKKTDVLREISVNGVFVFIGHDPSSKVVKEVVACDESGYVKTNENFETSIKGIFACGEIRSGATWQLVSACGEGCSAALQAEKYLENLS
jgi:thioredoxin reductase (NADPH)